MALSDGPASAIQVERAQELARERRARFERSAAEDRARTSDVRDTVDESGTAWRYVVVDGEWIRIVSCEARSEALVIPEAIEGKPVMALAPDACARQDGVRSIVCPDTLASIGPCAFRENEDRIPSRYRGVRFSLGAQLPQADLVDLAGVVTEDRSVHLRYVVVERTGHRCRYRRSGARCVREERDRDRRGGRGEPASDHRWHAPVVS